MPDSVWQIVLVPLLRAFEYYRWEQAQLLREGIHQFGLVCSGAETADRKLALWTAAFIRWRCQQREGPLSGTERDWDQPASWYCPRSLCVWVFRCTGKQAHAGKRFGKGPCRTDWKISFGTWTGLHVCRNPAARDPEQYPLLCGHGVLQQNSPRLCTDWTENEKTDAGGCRSAQYVLKLLCGGSQRPGR